MKIATSKNEGTTKKKPLLPLVPDPEEELNASNSVSYLLRVKPSDNDSPTFKKYIRVLSGNESVRTVLTWSEDQAQVIQGLNITDEADIYALTKGVLTGSAKTIYTTKVETDCTAAKTLAVAAATAANKAAEQAKPLTDYLTSRMIRDAKRELIKGVVPNKIVAMVKRYLRREARKPADMKVRAYYQHLLRINNDELVQLPPFRPDQNMGEDELIDILVFGTPKSWTREMDRQGFDPLNKHLNEVVDFMERIEQSEDFDGQAIDHQRNQSSGNNKKKSKTSGKGKFCLLHGPNTHPTDECKVLKAKADDLKDGSSSSNNKKKGGKFGNKTWTKKAEESTSKDKKELAAFIKKAVAQGVQKELHSLDKKRKSEHDLNAFDTDNLKEFNYKMGDLKVSDSSDDDDSSVEV